MEKHIRIKLILCFLAVNCWLFYIFSNHKLVIPKSDPYYLAVEQFIKGNADPLYYLAGIERLGSIESFREYCRLIIRGKSGLYIVSAKGNGERKEFGIRSAPLWERMVLSYSSDKNIKEVIYWEGGEFDQHFPKRK